MTIKDQPVPTPNINEAIWNLVIQDMKDRDELGRDRYGTPLQGFNGRDALVDAYQEALDLVVYLRQAIWERDFAKSGINEIPAQVTNKELPLTPAPVQETDNSQPKAAEDAPRQSKHFIMTSENTYL